MPFAGYADFAACVAANSDKGDPNAYCGQIKHQVEGKSAEGHSYDDLPDDAKIAWRAAFDAALEKNDEASAGLAAWAAVYRRWEKIPNGWMPLKAFAEVQFKSIYKSDRIIFGSASVAMVDSDRQLITEDALRKAFRSYIERGHVLFYHKNIPVGEVLAAYTAPDGRTFKSDVRSATDGGRPASLDVVVRIYKDTKISNDVWSAVERGELRSFSIGGQVIGDTVEVCQDPKCEQKYERVDQIDLHEISLVPTPANEASYFNIIKSAHESPAVKKEDKAAYPWDECVSDQRDRGADDPEAVCAAIKNRTVAHAKMAKAGLSDEDARAEVREWVKHPFSKYWIHKVSSLESLIRNESSVALNCKNFTERAIEIVEGRDVSKDAMKPCKEGEHQNDEGDCVPLIEASAKPSEGVTNAMDEKKTNEPAPQTPVVKTEDVLKEVLAQIAAMKADVAALAAKVTAPVPAPVEKPVEAKTEAPTLPAEKKSAETPQMAPGMPSIDWSNPPWGPGDSLKTVSRKLQGGK